jgi:anthranilate/para-aminobenzoate synthase component I
LNDGRALASLSPELFLELGVADDRLVTCPMKGTRADEADVSELRDSLKDRAELAMIVDLLRNDLGRVCDLGTVRVDTAHRVERHGAPGAGVLQSTATISGLPRIDRLLLDAVMGCFPCGSVTGAPKVRAMQIIEELELTPRGPYCGAAGFVSDSGAMRFNVAIRTALFEQTEVSYSVGAGIVADSVPESEWFETLLKARAARSDA